MKNYLILLFIIIMSINCENFSKKETKQKETIGINLDFMDTSVRPNDDFFRYVNGAWIDSTQIPDDKTRWGSFDELRKNTDSTMLDVLKKYDKELDSQKKIVKKIERAERNLKRWENKKAKYRKKAKRKNLPEYEYDHITDPMIFPIKKKLKSLNDKLNQRKAIALFNFIIDVNNRNEQGIKPIEPYLKKIEQIQSTNDILTYLAETEPYGGGGIFGFSVNADAKDSNKNVGYLTPGPLGLPERDYYLEKGEDFEKIRTQYKEHIIKMLQKIGETAENAIKESEKIIAIETRMAAERMNKVDRRDPNKRYNPMSVEKIKEIATIFDWDTYLKKIKVDEKSLVISDKNYFENLNKIMKDYPVESWKAYLKWTLVNEAADKLTQEMDTINWEFYSKTLRGAKKQEPLEKRALRVVNWSIGEAIGQLYVKEKFPPEAKAQMKEMVKNLVQSYTNRINKLEWMDEKTKEKAIEKLTKSTVKIGYPDKWKDYSNIQFKNVNGYFQAMLKIAKFNFEKDIANLKKPVDKTEWFMAPQIVNAYYNPYYNEIVFPAAILQPPFFDFKADAAVNYGGIGAVIGHEISHGFDDSGSDFDANGNLVNWWTDKDLKQFNALGEKLVDQFNAIEVLPEVFINGKFTLGENIGDLGGINSAYDALAIYHKEHGKPENKDGFTPEQRFFISWGTIWRTKIRDEALKTQIRTDPHSPGVQRAQQPLKNVDAFYDAFNIIEGDSMYIKPKDRVYIW